MKLPPIQKIHEALTAIADNRIEISDNKAKFSSSDNSKNYVVEWNNNEYSSNDNATYWQGYPGYPIIAILMLQNKLDYNKELLQYFKDINWKKINTKFKNDYNKAAEYALSNYDSNTLEWIDKEIKKIYSELEELDIVIKKSKLYPSN